ncbi:equilibrative nucleoside transporter 3-like isoform X2 [Convolutriloba macropyga]
MGSLLPYNMFINATDYFNYKLRDISSNLSDYDYGDNGDESTLQKQFESYFTTFSTVSLLLMVFGNTLLVRCMSSNIRLVGSIVGAMLCFVPSIGLVKAHTNTWQVGFFAITIVNIVALNIVCATLQSASVGVANVIATTYTQAVIAGQAVAGIFSSVVQIICLAIFQDSEDSALLYFLVAEAFLVILLVLAVLLLKNPTYCAAQAKVETENSTSDNENSKTVSMVMGETFMVFKRTLPLGFSVSFVFFVTLVIFPNFMAHIEPTDFEEGRYWYPVTVFLIFNVFDFIGRVLAGFFKRPSGTPAILMLCLSRSVFLVLYLFTNYQERYHLPVWFHSDYIVITFNILLALSNGYMASICFIYGARDVGPRADLQEQAGAVLTFFLSFGLCSGSALSFLYIDIP